MPTIASFEKEKSMSNQKILVLKFIVLTYNFEKYLHCLSLNSAPFVCTAVTLPTVLHTTVSYVAVGSKDPLLGVQIHL